MKAKLGILLMVLGSVLLAAALGLFLYNSREQQQAGEAVVELMPQLVDSIHSRQERSEEDNREDTGDGPAPAATLPEQRELPVVEIDGHGYIGFLGVPALGLELPVMAEWSYPKLKIAPCRFSGDLYSDDLVIMAHNFKRHFARLQDLREGDLITFTDMDGVTTEYQVVALDILTPKAVEEMVAGEYDLTLFTCTYGGQSRVTVRCDRLEP